jgi:hypothetical protein
MNKYKSEIGIWVKLNSKREACQGPLFELFAEADGTASRRKRRPARAPRRIFPLSQRSVTNTSSWRIFVAD